MKTTGRLKAIDLPFRAKKPIVSFELDCLPEDAEKYQDMELDLKIEKHRNHRSLDANAMLWACLGELAQALRTDNWSMYLFELERYGKYTYLLVRPEAVDGVREQWRETKVVGDTIVDDPETGEPRKMVQMICFFGSSTYNTQGFSRLLDGVVSDMRDIHLTPPPDEDMKQLIREMEKREHDKARRQQEAREGRQK